MRKDAEEVIIAVGKREPRTFSNLFCSKRKEKKDILQKDFRLKVSIFIVELWEKNRKKEEET